MHDYDKSSKWLIQHHGDSILRLAGINDIVSWRPLQAEVVQPRQLPDGLLEVHAAGRDEPDLFLIELATYPEERLNQQLTRGLMLAYLDRKILPEVVAVVFHPKGSAAVGPGFEVQSRRSLAALRMQWRVVNLWDLRAEDLLRIGDVGLIPWVPLTQSQLPPDAMLRDCRERIECDAMGDERENLLAVTQVLARLRYNDDQLLAILGGKSFMIKSPLIDELVAEGLVRQLCAVLEERFGHVPRDVLLRLQSTWEEDLLIEMSRVAARCADLETFEAELVRRIPAIAPMKSNWASESNENHGD